MKRTTALFVLPGFLKGMASTLDIGSTINMFRYSKSSFEADVKALRSDWAAVGDDIQYAMDVVEKEYVEAQG